MKRSLLMLTLVVLGLNAIGQNDKARADMQFEMRAYDDAITSYEQALQYAPGDQDLCAAIARSYVQIMDNLQASQWYEKLADRSDVNPAYLLEYANVLKSLRLYAKAKYYYQKYRQFDAAVADHFVQSCEIAKAEMSGPEMFEVVNVQVNSGFSEYGPVIYNGDLMFNSFRTDIKDQRKSRNGSTELSDNEMPFISASYGSKVIRHFQQDVGGEKGAAHVRYSGNGNWVAFDRNDLQGNQRLIDDRAGKTSMFIAEVDNKGQWKNIRPFPHNGNAFASGYPSLSQDGSLLYFASTRAGGYGGWDLYVSFKSQSGWTKPQNLGPAINTAGNEIAPCFVDKKLYFSSDWHSGFGGFDIFKAISSDGQWTTVRNMGYPLNSPKDDIDFFISSGDETGYVVSNRIGGKGLYDIYACTPQFEEVTMVVKEQSNGNPITDAIVTYKGSNVPVSVTNAQGRAIIHQPKDGSREIVISKSGFKDMNMTLRAEDEGPSRYEVFIDKSSVTTLAQVDEPIEQPATEQVEANEPVTTAMVQTETTAAALEAEVTKTNNEHRVETRPTSNVEQYSVQVAALGKESSLQEYEHLASVGTVMQVPEGNYFKVRVGYFKSISDAKVAARRIKNSGYPDAYVVTSKASATAGTKVQPEIVPVEKAYTEKYMVRLATYSQPAYFKSESIEHLGTIESYRKNAFTIMLISGFNTAEAAEIARVEAARRGFPDAYVVVDRDGQLQRVHTTVTER